MSSDQAAALIEKPGMDQPVIQSPPAYAPPEVAVKGGPSNTDRPTDPSLNTVYLAVFSMLFCLWPCALIGLILGIQSMQEYYRGQYDDSAKTEKKAKRWVFASIISGIILTVTIITSVVVVQAVVYGIIFTKDVDDK